MDILLAMPLFLALVVGVQHFDRKAQATLSSEEKARLLDFKTDAAKWHMVPLILLLLAYGGFSYLKPETGNSMIGLTVFIVLMAVLTIGSDRRHTRKLLTLDLPESYLATTRKTRLVTTIASLLFFLWIASSTFFEIGRLGEQMK